MRVLLLAIVALGGFLRGHQIGSKGLWLDEAFSVWLAWQPVGEMLAWLLRIDQHPPLYYALLHFWMALGDDAVTVRALSALLGTLTIPVMFLLGRRLADEKIGLLAALILAASPFHVRFAQETRMYTLLMLNATLSLYCLARLLTDPRVASVPVGRQFIDLWRTWQNARAAERETQTETVGYAHDLHGRTDCAEASARPRLPLRALETDLAWVGYMVFTTATLLSHNTAVFFPVAINLFILGSLVQRLRVSASSHPRPAASLCLPSLSNWLVAQAGTFLLWSPWLRAFIVQSTRVYHEFWLWPPTWRSVVEAVGSLLCAFLPQQPRWFNMVWVLYAILLALGIVRFRRHTALTAALLLITFATPFAGELLVSLRRPIFYDRTLIWASIPLYLLLAAGLRQLRYLPHILASLCIILANFVSLRNYYVHFQKEEWDKAAAYVAEHVEPDDLILFNATWVQIPFDFYFRTYGRPVVKHGVPVDLFDRGILEPKMAESDLPRLRALIRGRERVWLIYSHNWYTDPQGLIPMALGQELELLIYKDFFGLQVRLYGIR